MKLSTKAQYGLKACFYLADNFGKGCLSVSQLSKLTSVSESYLEQLMIPLRKAELIASERGANGGYTLIKSPEKVTVGEIVRALEDNLEILDCLTKGCLEKETCPTCFVWNKLYSGINAVLDGINLQEMLQDYKINNENI